MLQLFRALRGRIQPLSPTGQDLQAHDRKWLEGLPREQGTRSVGTITETNSFRNGNRTPDRFAYVSLPPLSTPLPAIPTYNFYTPVSWEEPGEDDPEGLVEDRTVTDEWSDDEEDSPPGATPPTALQRSRSASAITTPVHTDTPVQLATRARPTFMRVRSQAPHPRPLATFFTSVLNQEEENLFHRLFDKYKRGSKVDWNGMQATWMREFTHSVTTPCPEGAVPPAIIPKTTKVLEKFHQQLVEGVQAREAQTMSFSMQQSGLRWAAAATFAPSFGDSVQHNIFKAIISQGLMGLHHNIKATPTTSSSPPPTRRRLMPLLI